MMPLPLLQNEFCKLISESKFSSPGPHALSDIDSLLNLKEAQIHIYTLIKGKTISYVTSRPKDLVRDRKQIYVFETEREGLFHCDLIKEPGYFFNMWGQHCHFCHNVTNSSRSAYRHICEKKNSPSCHECRRPYLEEGDVYHPNMYSHYCKKKTLSKDLNVPNCDRCNFSFHNTDCKKHHNNAFCVKRYKCKKCKQVLKVSSHTDPKIARHDCKVKECASCKTPMPIGKAHFCSLFKGYFQKTHPNLGFLNIMHQIQEDGSWIPCMAMVMAEEWEKGTFVKKCFTKDPFEINLEEEDNFKAVYWNKVCSQFTKTTGKVSFGNEKQCRDGKFPIQRLGVLGQFFDYILNQKRKQYHNTTVLVADHFDMSEVLRSCILLNIERDLRNKGSKVICLRLLEFNITFLVLENYLTQKKVDYRLKHGTLDEPLFFPSLLTPEEMTYIGQSPSENYYDSFRDSKQVKEIKTLYIAKMSQRTNWNYQREALRFLNFETECIAKCALTYVQGCWDMNNKLKSTFSEVKCDENEQKLIHPFTRATPTASGVIYLLFRIYILNHEDIRIVHYEHEGRPIYNCSKAEHEYTSYLHSSDPNVISVFTHGAGLEGFKGKGKPDAYDLSRKIAYYLHGCYTHGHSPHKCSLNRERLERMEVKLAELKYELETNITDEEQIQELQHQIKEQNIRIHQFHYWREIKEKNSKARLQQFLQENSRTVLEHEVMYDCKWQELKTTDQQVSHFMTFIYEPRPLDQRLVPRRALKGGLVETYKFAWTNDAVDECFEYLDVVSLYPYLACKEYPVGEPQIWIGPQLEDVKFCPSGRLVRHEEQLCGLAHVKVFPPRDCSRPVLAYETSSKRKLYALCAACAEAKNEKPCKHNAKNRSWIGHYCIEEIELAYSKGYSFEILEIYHYSTRKAFMKPFIRILALEKIKASGWPSGLETEAEKEDYLDKINTFYETLGTELQLYKSHIQFNKEKRQFIKNQLNSLLGKLAQGANELSLRTVTHHRDLWHACESKDKPLYDFQILGNSCLLYQQNLRPGENKRGNSIVYAMITARGRVLMFNQMDFLEKLGCSIYAVSTDCIAFSRKKHTLLPTHLIGDLFGQFKKEYSNICSYLSLGPRNYNVIYKNDNGQEESVIKVSGLMVCAGNVEKVNWQFYKQMVSDFLEGKETEADIAQERVSKSHEIIKTVSTKYKLRSCVYSSRSIVRLNEEVSTLPYGYTNKATS